VKVSIFFRSSTQTSDLFYLLASLYSFPNSASFREGPTRYLVWQRGQTNLKIFRKFSKTPINTRLFALFWNIIFSGQCAPRPWKGESFLFRECFIVLTITSMKRGEPLLPNLVCTVFVFLLLASAKTGFAQPKEGGSPDDWRQLFDGASLNGWRHVGLGGFKVKDGMLMTEGGMGLLWYTGEKFSNCQIKAVFKLSSAKDDSGVYVRIPERPTDASDGFNFGYEVQIDNSGDPWHRTGCLYSVTRAQSTVLANVGEWNTMIITLFGPRTRVHVNGVLVTDHLEENRNAEKTKWYEGERRPRPDAGFIGLQNHDAKTSVYFKEISARRLK
jgi:hypothetical protein